MMMLKILKMLKNRKGFTLVELMAVIAVIGILAAIVVPKFSGATDQAKVAQIQGDLRTIGAAVTMYYATEGKYPDSAAAMAPTYLTKEPKPPKGAGDELKYTKGTDGEFTCTFKGVTYSSFGGSVATPAPSK